MICLVIQYWQQKPFSAGEAGALELEQLEIPQISVLEGEDVFGVGPVRW